MKLEAPVNPNYAAVVVSLKEFRQLDNCDNVQHAVIFGNFVIVGKDAKEGDVGLFFPLETALSPEFLSNNNLYRKSSTAQLHNNVDPGKAGFFEQHGRIRCVKFRGHRSEGFYIPISSLNYIVTPMNDFLDVKIGDTFDRIGDHEICKKYVRRVNPERLPRTQGKVPRLEDRIVPDQFRFHFDTENLRRNIHQIQPTDIISVSEKWHGTSVVIANILVKRVLTWRDRLAKLFGVKVQEDQYGNVYSSRRVIKAVNGESKDSRRDFYTSDIWGTVAKEVQGKLPPGFTVYGEIVGFTEDGAPIQQGYHYGCLPKAHKFLVYRVTFTDANGKPYELTWFQMREFCTRAELEMVPTIYYGQAQRLFPWLEGAGEAWQEQFLASLEKEFVSDQLCKHNKCQVPEEGIVVSKESLHGRESWKLKNFRFLEHETKAIDKGAADLEEEASVEAS